MRYAIEPKKRRALNDGDDNTNDGDDDGGGLDNGGKGGAADEGFGQKVAPEKEEKAAAVRAPDIQRLNI